MPAASAPPAVPAAAAQERFRRRMARWLAISSAALLVLLAWQGVTTAGPDAAAVGTPLPPFELPLLGGGVLTDRDLAGRVTVLNVWASWCPPCRSEAPVLRRVSAEQDPALVRFLGVVRNDDPQSAAEFVDDFDLQYPNVLDDGAFGDALGVRGLPMTFIIDRTGELFARHFGPISEPRLRVLIEDARSREAPGGGALGSSTQ